MAEKLYMLTTPEGWRKAIDKQQADVLLRSGNYQKLVDTSKLLLLRDKSDMCSNKPERRHYLGGGRLRHPFS